MNKCTRCGQDGHRDSQCKRWPILVTLPWPPKPLHPNERPHHMAKARAAKQFKEACYWQAFAAGIKPNQQYTGEFTIHMEFFRPTNRGRKPDRDNLTAAMKHGIDGLAMAMGIDDNAFHFPDPVIASEIGGMVKVRITAMEDA